MWKAVRDGIDPEKESESEQESERYGEDHAAAIGHSLGCGGRRIGFLFGFCLSPPLALAASKHKTLVRCTTRRDRLVLPNRINQASATESLEFS